MMGKPAKNVLRNYFSNAENSIVLENHNACVVDGGALLHKVFWPKSIYSERYQKYSSVSVNVIFDSECYLR